VPTPATARVYQSGSAPSHSQAEEPLDTGNRQGTGCPVAAGSPPLQSGCSAFLFLSFRLEPADLFGMSFYVESDLDGTTLILTVSGQLSSQAYEAFVKAVRTHSQPINDVVIDVSAVDSIDSAGLGMLLITREAAGANRATIKGCSKELRRVLDIVSFGQLFEIV